jgi:hypothetical protein
MMELHTRYHQPTVFDQLWLALARGLRCPAWLRGRRAWGWTFGLLALLFGLIGATFLLRALAPAAGDSALASLGSALLALGVFRHFVRCALPLLRPHGSRRRSSRAESGPASRPAPAGTAVEPGARPRTPPLPAPSAAERRACLAGLRAAGVNLGIARALAGAGYASGTRLRNASDAEILAIRGVGPATLSKIRACFPA